MKTQKTFALVAACALAVLGSFNPAFADPGPFPTQLPALKSMTADGDTLTAVNVGQSLSYTMAFGYTDAWNNPQTAPATGVTVLNPNLLSAAVSDGVVTLTALKPGITSVLVTKDPSVTDGPSAASYGVMVCETDGTKPLLPDYPFISSRAIMGQSDVEKWYEADGLKGLNARRTDAIDIYLTGGPDSWVSINAGYNGFPGVYLTDFVRACKRQGRIPAITFYCIEPLGADDTALMALSAVCEVTGPYVGTDYMDRYYHRTVRVMREVLARTVSDGWPAVVIVEPDFLGYMASGFTQTIDPDAIPSMTNGATNYEIKVSEAFKSGPAESFTNGAGTITYHYSTDPLLDASETNSFPNSLSGFVKSIPHILKKSFSLNGTNVQLGSNVLVGWQANLWASSQARQTDTNALAFPGGNLFGGTGTIARWTDATNATVTFSNLVGRLQTEATAIGNYYKSNGVAVGTDFLAFDRYGSDAGSKFGGINGGTSADPSGGEWFFNYDHWNNYLAFVDKVSTAVNLPVVLWQLPMGHINATTAVKPDGTAYAPLSNAANSGAFEDASSTFWFGDTFTAATPQRAAYFSKNNWGTYDPARAGDVSVSGSKITWKPGLLRLGSLNKPVLGVLFGAGVGSAASTIACAQAAAGTTDDYWWINKAQRYYAATDSAHAATVGFSAMVLDADIDGISDYDELSIHGTAPDDPDSNNDGLTDGGALALDLPPSMDSSPAIAYGRAQVTSDPAAHGLYTSNSIMDLNIAGGMMMQKQGSNAVVTLQFQTSTNLVTFADYGSPITNTIPMPGDKGFIRVQAKP